ncbi:fimbrillin family protein, partial [Bacteroides fragilis]|uniref:fimbrillin family protein n=1 Tax=Bacteroides fragilis TaxID=817 RepID=UPI001112F32A
VIEGSIAGHYPWTSTPFALNLVPSGISGSQLSFNPNLYYPLGGKRVISYSYYPPATATSGSTYITAPGNGVAPAYHFTLTGTDDIMYAAGTPTGSTSTMPVSLTFNHVLTHLQLNTSPLGAMSSSKRL